MQKGKMSRYMNMMTDFAFKKIFATEENKALLIAFLNETVPPRETKEAIVDVQYLPTEQLGNIEEDRKAIFDIYCTDAKGKRYIIEMQIGRQEHFMERSLFYATFPVQSQAVKGKWNFAMKPLYHIAILNFIMFPGDKSCLSHISLIREETGEKASDILNFVVIELPKFRKKIRDLETNLDYWMFSFKNLYRLKEPPPGVRSEIFDKLFSVADTKKLTKMEKQEYRKSVAEYADVQLMMDYSKKEGMQHGLLQGERRGLRLGKRQGLLQGEQRGLKKGVQQGLLQGEQRGLKKGVQQGQQQALAAVAKSGFKKGMSVETVSELTGLPIQEVKLLLMSL
jgi:predicted transposase/invertase (TIGR01784 family)